MVIRTVGDLIEALKDLPADSVPVAPLPPFVGVRLVPQSDGKLLIASPDPEDEID